jgi:hypothetical protein
MGIDERIILIQILNKTDVRVYALLNWLRLLSNDGL